jgi:hypothetical protein
MTYCRGRSSRPARLFSFSLLDGPQVCLRRLHMREAYGKKRALARLGRAGEIADFGLSRFATAFRNNPGWSERSHGGLRYTRSIGSNAARLH